MKNIFPIVIALITTLLTGLILFPLVRIIFDRFFELYVFTDPPPDHWKNDLILGITLFVWVFIASGVGGFFCSNLTAGKYYVPLILFLVISMIIFSLVTKGAILTDFDPLFLIPLFSFIAGAYSGAYIGSRSKLKTKDTPPSLSGNS